MSVLPKIAATWWATPRGRLTSVMARKLWRSGSACELVPGVQRRRHRPGRKIQHGRGSRQTTLGFNPTQRHGTYLSVAQDAYRQKAAENPDGNPQILRRWSESGMTNSRHFSPPSSPRRIRGHFLIAHHAYPSFTLWVDMVDLEVKPARSFTGYDWQTGFTEWAPSQRQRRGRQPEQEPRYTGTGFFFDWVASERGGADSPLS